MLKISHNPLRTYWKGLFWILVFWIFFEHSHRIFDLTHGSCQPSSRRRKKKKKEPESFSMRLNIAVHDTIQLVNLTDGDVSALACHVANVTFNPPDIKEQRQVCEQCCSRCHHYSHASHITQALLLQIRQHQPWLFSYNKPHSVLFLMNLLESGSDSRERDSFKHLLTFWKAVASL